MPRHLMFVLLVVIAVGYAIPLGHSEVVGVRRVLTQMPVTGRLEHGGTFAGRLTVEELVVNDLGQLAATGVLEGTASTQAGDATPVPPHTVITPASLLDLRGTCTTLVLDVEPVFLEPLRQEVTLGQSPWTCTLCQRPSTSWALPCVPWHASRNKAGGAKLQRPIRCGAYYRSSRRCRTCCTTRRTSSA